MEMKKMKMGRERMEDDDEKNEMGEKVKAKFSEDIFFSFFEICLKKKSC